MRFQIKKIAVFCSVLTCLGPSSFALSNPYDGGPQRTKGPDKRPVAAIVRVENGQPICVKYADNISIDSSKLTLPLCSNDSTTDEQTNQAMALAQAGTPTQTAFLTHFAFATMGCVYGMVMPMFGASLESAIREDGRSTSAGFAAGTAGGGAFGAFILYTVSEPTGHMLAAATGYLVCAGAIDYLVFREKMSRAR